MFYIIFVNIVQSVQEYNPTESQGVNMLEFLFIRRDVPFIKQ